jgi:hypothetical protein
MAQETRSCQYSHCHDRSYFLPLAHHLVSHSSLHPPGGGDGRGDDCAGHGTGPRGRKLPLRGGSSSTICRRRAHCNASTPRGYAYATQFESLSQEQKSAVIGREYGKIEQVQRRLYLDIFNPRLPDGAPPSSLSAPIQFSSMYPDPRTVHAHLQGDPPAHVKAYHINRAYGPMLRQAWPYGTVDDCGMSTVHAITRRRTCHAAHRHDYCSSQMAAQVLHSRRGPPTCVS